MNRFQTVILIFILTFSLYSCTENKKKRKDVVAEKIAQFSDRKAEWNKLTNWILENHFVNSNLGKGIYPSDLEQSLSTELIKNGIKFITVRHDSECKEVEYATEWTEYPIGTLNLTWTTCDPKQTEKGFSTEYGFIEVFGIGNNWLIVVDSDFI